MNKNLVVLSVCGLLVITGLWSGVDPKAVDVHGRYLQPPPQSGQGPYFHQIYSASSADELSWTHDNVLLLDHASVPAAIVT